METLTTWEMIRGLTDNPYDKYEMVNRFSNGEKVIIYEDRVVWEKEKIPLVLAGLDKNKWRKVPQEITVVEALEIMKKSQCVKFKVGKNNGIAFFEHIANNLVVHVDSDGKKLTNYIEKTSVFGEALLYGKWYKA